MDPFPRLHPRPATGWVNDPNGVGRWDGRWHVMMQWNPHAPRWGDIHWAHLSSTDLVRWDEHPPSLSPRPGAIDAGGCWSGVATRDDAGHRALVYSATPAGPAEVGVAIARERADGGFTQPDSMTVPHPTHPRVKDVRDPFLFTVDGRRLAVQGSRIDDAGAVLVWDATDLNRWQPLGELLRAVDVPAHLDRRGEVWECPQLVPIEDRWVLVVSWMMLDGSARGALAYTGDLVATAGEVRFSPTYAADFDHGPDFYAPQLALVDGRVLALGWADEARAQDAVDAAGWAGTLTFPREVTLDARGAAVMRPVPELDALLGEAFDSTSPFSAPAWMATVSGPWSLALVSETGERRVLEGAGDADIWVDGSIVEVFDAVGSTTARAYPEANEGWRLDAPSASSRELRLP